MPQRKIVFTKKLAVVTVAGVLTAVGLTTAVAVAGDWPATKPLPPGLVPGTQMSTEELNRALPALIPVQDGSGGIAGYVKPEELGAPPVIINGEPAPSKTPPVPLYDESGRRIGHLGRGGNPVLSGKPSDSAQPSGPVTTVPLEGTE